MKAVLPGFFSRGLVPNGVLVSQGNGPGVVGVVIDELEVLEDLPPLFDLAPAGRVVVDRQHNGPTSCGDSLTSTTSTSINNENGQLFTLQRK